MKKPSKDEARQAFMLAYTDSGSPWGPTGEEAFERWWRGESNVVGPEPDRFPLITRSGTAALGGGR